ncbi:MAG: LolA family protein [Terriglobales bacterium]
MKLFAFYLAIPLAALLFTLDGRYNSMHSWEADFSQTYTSGFTATTEFGHLYLRKPGRMRWDYAQPTRKTFIVNGNKIWQYTAGDAHATLTSVAASQDLRTPLRYLLGHIDLPKQLNDISYSGLTPWHAGDYVIHGAPRRDEATAWSEVWIEITPAYEMDRIVIASPDGGRNDIRFSHIHPNIRLSGSLFTFTPPPGVTLVPGR